MRLILLCLLVLGFGATTNLNAQQEKTTKKVRIVKKTVDANGNETIEEVEAEGEEAERLIKKMELDKKEEVRIETEKHIEIEIDDDNKEKSAGKKQQIRIELDGEDWDTFKESKEFKQLPAEVQERLKNVDLEGKGKDADAVKVKTKKHKRIMIKKIDGEQEEVMEWEGKEGEELPDDIKKMLEEKGIDLEMDNEEGANVFVMKDSGAKRATLGVQLIPGSDAIKIDKIMDDSAAAKAGLKEGDIIKKINGLEIANVEVLIQKLRKYEVGEHINLEFERGGKVQNQTVILEASPALGQQKSIWIDKDGKKTELQDEDVIIFKKDN